MTNLSTSPASPACAEVATLAGGCFWCTEAIFNELKGVEKVVSGYAGGSDPSPTYEQVCAGRTGHAECVQVTFNPSVVSFHDLLMIFFTTHDPTTLNRQGADVGTQYRSAVFTHDEGQAETARAVIGEIREAGLYGSAIVTEVTPFTNFYAAEAYHQDYYASHGDQGYCRAVILPKVSKFRAHYREKLKR